MGESLLLLLPTTFARTENVRANVREQNQIFYGGRPKRFQGEGAGGNRVIEACEIGIKMEGKREGVKTRPFFNDACAVKY